MLRYLEDDKILKNLRKLIDEYPPHSNTESWIIIDNPDKACVYLEELFPKYKFETRKNGLGQTLLVYYFKSY